MATKKPIFVFVLDESPQCQDAVDVRFLKIACKKFTLETTDPYGARVLPCRPDPFGFPAGDESPKGISPIPFPMHAAFLWVAMRGAFIADMVMSIQS